MIQLQNLVKNFAQLFWALWRGHLDPDFEKLQQVIEKENKIRRERHARSMRQVTKSEFIIFIALTIGCTVFAQSGQNLWNTNETQNNVRKKMSSNADFGKYFKLWRLKELRSVVPKMMEDITLNEQVDFW